MNKKITKTLFFLSIISLFYTSCDYETSNRNNNVDTIYISQTDNIKKSNLVYTKYNIPLTIDLFQLIQEKSQFIPNNINPKENSEKYLSIISKAINLGIYTTDLAYCNIFSQGQQSVEYFNLTKEIANSLHIEKGYNQDFIERLDANIDNKDSLISIANDSYWRACNYLDENGNNNILPFVVFGGWIESLYIIINSQGENLSAELIKKYLIEQNTGLENLINYLYDVQIESTAFYFNGDLKIIIKQLETLSILFEKYEFKKNKDKIYQDITNLILDIRKKYVLT